MTVNEILARLKSLGDDARRAHNTKAGAPDNQFGVKPDNVRAMTNNIMTDHELALKLWDTGNVEAQLLAALIIAALAVLTFLPLPFLHPVRVRRLRMLNLAAVLVWSVPKTNRPISAAVIARPIVS